MSQHFRSVASWDLLREMLRSTNPDRISDAAGLFRRAGLRTFLEHREWVIEALQRGAAAGDQCLDDVKSDFVEAATADGKAGTPGEPFATDVKLNEEATKIAETLSPGSPERAFFEGLLTTADAWIVRSLEEGERLEE
jgi:hypothetical protein